MIKYELVQVANAIEKDLELYRFEATLSGKVYFTAFLLKKGDYNYRVVSQFDPDYCEPDPNKFCFSYLEEFYLDCVEKASDKLSAMTWG